MRRFLFVAFALGLSVSVPAQFSQSLPNNLLTTEGSTSSAYPWSTTAANCWHWNYDTSNFVANFPIIITGLYVRPNGGGTSAGGTDQNVEVQFASSLVDWSTTGNGTVFASVMDVDATIVYSGSVTIPAGVQTTPAAWVPIGPITPFLYNPAAGKDFIIQVRAHGPNVVGMAAVDLHANGSAQRYGSQTSSTVTAANFSNVNIVPVVKIDYVPAAGLYAGFNASPVSGPAPLTVNFTNTSYTSDPGGFTSYAWDLDGDSIIDSTIPNPTFTYLAPGLKSVTLTVTDATNPASTITRTGYINVGQYVFSAGSSGGGVGDLTISGIPIIGAPAATQGFTLISFATTSPVGTGPFFGLVPDATVFSVLTAPAGIGNPLHYLTVPGIYPDAPLVVPPGSLTFLAGVSADFAQIGLDAGYNLQFWSTVSRVTF